MRHLGISISVTLALVVTSCGTSPPATSEPTPSAQSDSKEEVMDNNKARTLELFDGVLNGHEPSRLAGLVDENLTETTPTYTQLAGEWTTRIEAMLGGFPNARWDVADLAAQGDLVAVRSRFSGTHDGQFGTIEPTGGQVGGQRIDLLRYRNGQIVEHVEFVDEFALLTQIGAFPAPDLFPLVPDGQSAAGTGTPEENAAVVVGLYEDVFNAHDLSVVDDFIPQDYVQHNPAVPQGREGFVGFFESFFAAAPDASWAVQDVVAENDLVFVWHRVTGTFTDPFNGSQPTGQPFEILAVDQFRVSDGMLIEHWDVVDNYAFASAFGLGG